MGSDTPTNPQRINPITPASSSTASPTGVPWVPPKVVPFLLVLAGVAGGVAYWAPDGGAVDAIAKGALAILSFVGIASPGLRR